MRQYDFGKVNHILQRSGISATPDSKEHDRGIIATRTAGQPAARLRKLDERNSPSSSSLLQLQRAAWQSLRAASVGLGQERGRRR